VKNLSIYVVDNKKTVEKISTGWNCGNVIDEIEDFLILRVLCSSPKKDVKEPLFKSSIKRQKKFL